MLYNIILQTIFSPFAFPDSAKQTTLSLKIKATNPDSLFYYLALRPTAVILAITYEGLIIKTFHDNAT